MTTINLSSSKFKPTKFKPGVSSFEGQRHTAGKVLKHYLKNGNSRKRLISVGIVLEILKIYG